MKMRKEDFERLKTEINATLQYYNLSNVISAEFPDEFQDVPTPSQLPYEWCVFHLSQRQNGSWLINNLNGLKSRHIETALNRIFSQTKQKEEIMAISQYESGLIAARDAGPMVWNKQLAYAKTEGYASMRHLLECVTMRGDEWIAGYLDGMGADANSCTDES